MPETKYSIPLFFILGLSIVIKGIVLFHTPLVNNDGPMYIAAAQEIAAGNLVQSLRHYSMPLYPLLIATVQLVVGDWVRAGQLVSLLCLTLAVIPLYRLSLRIFGPVAAFWAGMAFALWPLANRMAGTVYRDPPFLLLSALALWSGALSISSERKGSHFFLVSFFSFLALLCRLEGALLLAFFPLAWIVAGLSRRGDRKAFAGGILIFLLLPAVALFFVFLPGNGLEFNRFTDTWQRIQHFLGGSALANYKIVYSRLSEMQLSLPYGHWGGSFAEMARHYLWLIYLVGLVDRLVLAATPAFFLWALLGFSRSPENRATARLTLYLIASTLLLLYTFYIYYNFLEVRYALLAAFLLFPWVGAGLERMAVLMKGRVHRYAPAVLLSLLVLFCTERSFRDLSDTPDLTVKQAGGWLAAQGDLRSYRLVSNDPTVAFYADRFRDYHPHPVQWTGDFQGMEEDALANGGELLALRIPPSRVGEIPPFAHFDQIARFIGHEQAVLIFQKRSGLTGLR